MFSNLVIDPRDTLKITKLESTLWAKAHVVKDQTREHQAQNRPTVLTSRRWCFIDSSWKDKDLFSRQGWYRTLQGFDGLLGARNVRACLSPLHWRWMH